MKKEVINIILCGGFGSRLWPLSRENYPKPLLPLFDGQSLLSMTLNRHQGLADRTIIVTNAAQVKNMQAEVEKHQITNVDFIVESLSKNTAPAITMAALSAPEGATLIVTPSDHYIPTNETYQSDIELAIHQAESDYLLLFGIPPVGPSTEYGYIETISGNSKCQDIQSFHEKPQLDIAKEYIKQSNFFWNSGIFCFSRETFLNELQDLDAVLMDQCKQAVESIQLDGHPVEINTESMYPMKKISIDYAVMEKSNKLQCIQASFDWNDCGTFNQMKPFLTEDNENFCQKNTHLISASSTNNVIFGGNRPIALHDVHDLSIIDTDDVILVSNRSSNVPFTGLIDELKKGHPELCSQSKWEIRPWGRFDILIEKSGFKVKKIEVNPGGQLSLQKHQHRQEHWVVVEGIATVQVDESEHILSVGESISIPKEAKHRLKNNGDQPLAIIETQIGSYLGEDDIIRFDDVYGRSYTV